MTSAPASIPKRLGRYEILERLAVGGQAEVFLARERGMAGLERLVVVKRILPHLAAHPTFIDMFLQEARFAARLAHPNVVPIHELGQEGDDFFIAMEYVEGISIRELMSQGRIREEVLPVGAVVGVVAQACAGAHAAHELKDSQGNPLGLVHRDVTPHNLMVTIEGHVKLLDFGVAKSTTDEVNRTQTGTLKGKLRYLSPEQCCHEKLDRRTDLFSMGVILWEMLAGETLFKRDSELETLQAIVEDTAPDLRELRPDLPIGITAVVTCALAKYRDERFATANEMRRALLAAAEEAYLDTSTDAVGELVIKLCGETLERDRAALQDMLGGGTATTDLVSDEGLIGIGGAGTETVGASAETAAASDVETQVIRGQRRPTYDSTEILAPSMAPRPTPPPPPRRSGPTVRIGVLFFALAAAAAVFYWARTEPAPTLTGPVLTVGLAPAIDPAVIMREFTPLKDYLERSTGRPFSLQMATNYRALSEDLLEGRVHFALIPPNMYIGAHARDPRVAVSLRARYAGTQGSDCVLLVREDSPAKNVADLRGKRMCYTDPDSTSGFRLPRATLRRAGVDLDREMTPPHYSGNHLQLLQDLIAGRCDAGGTFHSNFVAAGRSGIPVAQLRVLALTGRTPHEAFCSGPEVSEDDRRMVEEALLSFDPPRHIGEQWLGAMQRLSGFDRASDSDFDDLRQALRDNPALLLEEEPPPLPASMPIFATPPGEAAPPGELTPPGEVTPPGEPAPTTGEAGSRPAEAHSPEEGAPAVR